MQILTRGKPEKLLESTGTVIRISIRSRVHLSVGLFEVFFPTTKMAVFAWKKAERENMKNDAMNDVVHTFFHKHQVHKHAQPENLLILSTLQPQNFKCQNNFHRYHLIYAQILLPWIVRKRTGKKPKAGGHMQNSTFVMVRG